MKHFAASQRNCGWKITLRTQLTFLELIHQHLHESFCSVHWHCFSFVGGRDELLCEHVFIISTSSWWPSQYFIMQARLPFYLQYKKKTIFFVFWKGTLFFSFWSSVTQPIALTSDRTCRLPVQLLHAHCLAFMNWILTSKLSSARLIS